MNSYNSNDYNKTSSFLRLVDTMKRAKENQRAFTLFIGAGCSLSSSNKPINTESLLLRCLQDHFDENYIKPNTWEILYSDFLNNIWENNGVEDRREILSDYFKGLKPGIGYQNLRLLVENGFITQIITTNFDLLLNEALQGIAYKLQVGNTSMRSIQGGSKIFVCKVHGDIENGELRFAPNELLYLPENISHLINSLTSGSCLFCGYRGQDFGVMNSVCKDSNHSIFWATPTKPIRENYETKIVYQLADSRNSQNNFIYGGELGDFDKLMVQLVRTLLNKDPVLALPVAWNKSVFGNVLSVNSKVLHMFEKILSASDELKDHYEKKNKSPYFAGDYQNVLDAFLFYYDNEREIPSVLQVPDNEVEALLVALAIEVLSRTASYDTTPLEYLASLRKLYEKKSPPYQPDEEFWSALYIVLDSCQSQLELKDNISQIRLIMNKNGRLTFNVKNPKLKNISDVLSILSLCGLFFPTSESDMTYDMRYYSKKILESRSYQEKSENNNIIFKIDSISKNEFNRIYNFFFKDLNATLDRTGKIVMNSLIVEANFKEKSNQNIPVSTISEYLLKIAEETSSEFQMLRSAFELEQGIYVSTPLEQELQNFTNSKKIGMFIVGSSGSGKTKAIQNFINFSSKEFIIAATAPKCGRMENFLGLDIFFNELKSKSEYEKKEFISNLNVLLESKNQQLLLIIDGINELNSGFAKCVAQYKAIIESINFLSDWKITNIKLIVTCRDFAFLDYCEYSGLYPPAKFCYYQASGKTIKAYYQIMPLTLDLQLKFCEAYISDVDSRELFINDLKNNKYLQKTFTSPYLIAIVGNYYKNNNSKKINLRIHDIFSDFTKQMLKRLNNYEDQSIAYKIIYTYFELVLSEEKFIKRITPFILLQNISDSERTFYVLNQLRDLNLLVDVENSEYIRFSHDRIEEYFLTEYLNNNNNCINIMKTVLIHASHEPIYWSGLQNYVKCCMEKEYYEQIIYNIDLWYNIDSDLLPQLLMCGLETLQKDHLIQFLYTAKKIMPSSIELLLLLFHLGLKKMSNNSNIQFPIEFIESIEQLSNIFFEFEQFKAYYYYTTSRYYFKIKNNQQLSLSYCDKALKYCDNNEILIKLIELQKTIIMKRNGEFNKNIFDEFSLLYKYFSSNNEWEYATECVLEWGSALRQSTQFKEALTVYEKIKLENIEKYPELLATLHRKKGTIYKNILQQKLRNKKTKNEYNKDEIQYYYDKAMKEYSSAKKAVERINDILEMITILSEQAETTLKIAQIIPEFRSLADIYISEEEKLISFYPIPDKMIVYLRELAMMAEQDGKYEIAIENLLDAKKYATKYMLSFRIFEVNYQLGRLINRTWEKLNSNQREIGIKALDEAIQYPLEPDNEYHKICLQTRDEISQKL